MKSLKKFTAVLLCITMLFCIFATGVHAENGLATGVLTEGRNQIPTDEYSYEFCFDFYADESGYYSIISDQADFDIFAEGSDNHALSATCFINETEDDYVRLYHLEKGGYKIYAYYYGESINIATAGDASTPVEGFEINIEKYGEITDVILDEEAYKDVVFGTSSIFSKDKNGNGIISDYADYTVVFSGGKTISCHYRFDLICNGEFVNGQNKITANFGFFKKEMVLTGYYITYYIESVELLSSPTAYKTYNGTYIYDDFRNSYKVNFADGTSTVASSTVILPDGQEFYINYSINDEAEISVYIVNHKYIDKQPLTVEEASYEKNYSYMKRLTEKYFSSIKEDWYYVFVGSIIDSFGITLTEYFLNIIEVMPTLLEYTNVKLRWIIFEYSRFSNYYTGTPILYPFS